MGDVDLLCHADVQAKVRFNQNDPVHGGPPLRAAHQYLELFALPDVLECIRHVTSPHLGAVEARPNPQFGPGRPGPTRH